MTEGTRTLHRVALQRVLDRLGRSVRIDTITPKTWPRCVMAGRLQARADHSSQTSPNFSATLARWHLGDPLDVLGERWRYVRFALLRQFHSLVAAGLKSIS